MREIQLANGNSVYLSDRSYRAVMDEVAFNIKKATCVVDDYNKYGDKAVFVDFFDYEEALTVLNASHRPALLATAIWYCLS